jgi:hypothetical protein
MAPRFILLLALVLARSAQAASVADVEREIGGETAEQSRLEGERQRLQAEATRQAAAVDQARASSNAARAGGDLSRALRAFDRRAEQLDAVERDLAAHARRLAQLRAEFETAADGEERRLQERAGQEGAARVAALLDALAESRKRVWAQAAAARFRPPLEIALEPGDGPAEIEGKRALLDAEIARVAQRRAEVQSENALLARRLSARREWARQLAAARRDAAGSVELLDRGYDQAQASIRDLGARAEELAQEQHALDEVRRRLETTRAEAEKLLIDLRKPR